jgi:hypothetical protein
LKMNQEYELGLIDYLSQSNGSQPGWIHKDSYIDLGQWSGLQPGCPGKDLEQGFSTFLLSESSKF